MSLPELALSEVFPSAAKIRETYKALQPGRFGANHPNWLWNVVLVAKCFDNGWCPIHPQWASYCVAGAAIAVVRNIHIVPPREFTSIWSAQVEYYVWPVLEQALREPNELGEVFSLFLLRQFCPCSGNMGDRHTDFTCLWDSCITRRAPDEWQVHLRAEFRRYGMEVFDRLHADVKKPMEMVTARVASLRTIYQDRVLVQRAAECERYRLAVGTAK
jgi:hypothetical protein